jgi:hypothetical protein
MGMSEKIYGPKLRLHPGTDVRDWSFFPAIIAVEHTIHAGLSYYYTRFG